MITVSDQLKEFLVEAKNNTYASESPVVFSEPYLESSKQFQYSSGRYLYRDIFFGSDKFSGIEVVYEDKIPIWTMVYSGGLDYPIDSREVYCFLKKALRNISNEFPARGPRIFREGHLTYENNYEGSIERFHGEEYILFNNSEVYRLSYYGGIVN